MKKYLGSLLVIFFLLFISIKVEAAEIVDGGTWDDELTWTLTSDGTLTISGEGGVIGGSWNDVPWYGQNDKIKSVVIEEGVYALGDYSFSDCYNLEEVTMANSVLRMGSHTFDTCKALKKVKLSTGLSEIGDYAFYACSSLSEITIPLGVDGIGVSSFAGCASLKELSIPQGLNFIDINAFIACTGLDKIVFCGDAPFIGSSVFYRTNVTCYYPEGNSTWTSNVMQQYEGTVTWIPYEVEDNVLAQGSCGENVSWVMSRDGVLTISGTGAMTDYDYDYNSAPWYSFNTSITSVVVNEGVTSIGAYAFESCTNLEEISLPSSLTRIGEAAFFYCLSLADITIPKNVASIEDVAFVYCNSLNRISVDSRNSYYCNDAYGVLYNKAKTKLITVPAKLSGKYMIPNTVETIAARAFLGCGELTEINIPNTINEIGFLTFGECKGLTQIVIPESVKKIGKNAFSNCTGLTMVNIPKNVTEMGDSVFFNCTNLETVVFRGNCPNFGTDTFYNMVGTVYYPEGNNTWASNMLQQYGGNIVWVAYDKICEGEHVFENWRIIVKPRCVIEGEERRDCVNCAFYEEEIVDPTGHNYVDEKIGASEYTVGYTSYTCVGCKENVIEFNTYNGITYEDAILYLRNELSHRSTSLKILYRDVNPGSNSEAKALYEKALEHCGIPYLGDYITGHPISGLMYSGSVAGYENGYFLNYAEYKFSYTTSYAQEEWVNSEIAAIMEELNLDGKPDYVKIRKINDYICNRISYDNSALADHTVHGTLKNNKAACQGYALLTYRLMLEAGIDCRYITGNTSAGLHAWNIVKLNGVYYNVDTTWNDQNLGIIYDYFLRNDANFRDHVRDADYMTEAFNDMYPIASEDYKGGSCGENLYWEIGQDGTLVIYGIGTMDEVTFTTCPWQKYRNEIKQVVIESGATEISDRAFYNCVNMTSIVIPESVKSIGVYAFWKCTSLTDITFLGDAPTIGSNAFDGVTAYCHYPEDNATWTNDVKQDYSGNLTWDNTEKHIHEIILVPKKEAGCTQEGLKEHYKCIGCEKLFWDYSGKEEITNEADTIIAALGHSFTQYISDGNATTSADGTKTAKCDRNGCAVTNTIRDEGSKLPEPEIPNEPETPEEILKSGWVLENGTWYYYVKGEVHKGWLYESGTWYYLNTNGAMATGWIKDGSSWYYMKPNGAMATGWVKDGGSWYYMKAGGAMATGWIKDGSSWYYMKANGAMATGWVKDGGSWYYMKANGTMATGWVKDGGSWYYMKSNGTMATGWVKDGNTWYYMNTNGTMATGWIKDGGSWYYLNSNGAWVA